MKQTHICPKCKAIKIGYINNVINKCDTSAGSYSVIGYSNAPLGTTTSESKKSFGIKIVKRVTEGELEAYLCASCGYYETYIKSPSKIQYENIDGFKWIT